MRRIGLALVLIVAGCHGRQDLPPQVSAPTPARWDGRHPDAASWSTGLLNTLRGPGSALLRSRPADATAFCPRHEGLDAQARGAVWLMLISGMAELESAFRPELTFTEPFTDAQGRPVVSRGLLQISLESSRGYDCGFSDADALHDPGRNLACGVRILSRWVERDGRIGGATDAAARGGGRYWSVLRPSRRRQSLEAIQSRTAAHPLCRP